MAKRGWKRRKEKEGGREGVVMIGTRRMEKYI